jgi:hypothetical protein
MLDLYTYLYIFLLNFRDIGTPFQIIQKMSTLVPGYCREFPSFFNETFARGEDPHLNFSFISYSFRRYKRMGGHATTPAWFLSYDWVYLLGAEV